LFYDFIPTPGPNEKQHQQLQNIQHHAELDFPLDHLGPFDCDVDEVIQRELSLGNDILANDFNFGGGNGSVTTLHNGSKFPAKYYISSCHSNAYDFDRLISDLGSVASTTSPSLHHPTPTTSYNTGVTAAVHHQQQAAVLGRQWVH